MTEQHPGKTHMDFIGQSAEYNHSIPQRKKKRCFLFVSIFFNLDFINVSVSPRTGTF